MHYYIFYLFTASLMILPTGTFFGATIKIPLFVACIYSLWIKAIKLKAGVRVTKATLSVIYSMTLLVLIMFFIGVVNGNKFAADELKYLLVVLSVLFVLIALSRQNIQGFLDSMFWATILYAIIKAVIYIGIFAGVLRIDQVLFFYMQAFDDRFVYMPITSKAYRIQFPPDIIYAFLPALHLAIAKKHNAVFSYIRGATMIFAAGFIVFTAYSRYLFFVFLVTLFIYSYYLIFKYRKAYYAAMAILVLLGIFNFNNLSGSKYFEERFSSRNNQYSDMIRVEQQEKLMDKWLQSPIIGSGAGAYLSDYVRTEKTPFSYEAQILGYLMKGGLLFLLPLFVFSIYFARCIYKNSGSGVCCLFILLLLSGLTNPYLTSSATAILYVAFYLLGSAGNKERTTC